MTDTNNNGWSLNLVIIGSVAATLVLFYLAYLGHQPVGGKSAGNAGGQTLEQRIRPVVTLDDVIAEKATGTQLADAAAAPKTAQQLYQGACLACHLAGVANAPKLGDSAAWAPRAAQGLEGLLQSAIQGKGAMPPKGASSYSDDELRRVIQYMLEQAGL